MERGETQTSILRSPTLPSPAARAHRRRPLSPRRRRPATTQHLTAATPPASIGVPPAIMAMMATGCAAAPPPGSPAPPVCASACRAACRRRSPVAATASNAPITTTAAAMPTACRHPPPALRIHPAAHCHHRLCCRDGHITGDGQLFPADRPQLSADLPFGHPPRVDVEVQTAIRRPDQALGHQIHGHIPVPRRAALCQGGEGEEVYNNGRVVHPRRGRVHVDALDGIHGRGQPRKRPPKMEGAPPHHPHRLAVRRSTYASKTKNTWLGSRGHNRGNGAARALPPPPRGPARPLPPPPLPPHPTRPLKGRSRASRRRPGAAPVNGDRCPPGWAPARR